MSPKISKANGPTYGGDDGWDGSSTPTSSEKASTTEPGSSPSGQSPAPTTDSPSSPDLTESSSADSTDGASADPYDGKTKTELQDELVARDLPKSGTVAELAERLRAHDAELEAADEYDEDQDGE